MTVGPGAKLGPYDVISFIGAGGTGEVYRARDTRLGRDVAIKVLRSDRVANDARRRRFTHEARTASSLNHPNIATIYDIASADGIDFIVMEHVAGKTLSAMIRSGMRLSDVLRVAIPIADALSCAHAAGIVHRDLKPANVAVANDGTVKVLDFGLAKLLEADDEATEHETVTEESFTGPLTRVGVTMGTPGYMSPEQATGGRIDARSDIFSFGSMLYEMVTGRRAFQGDSVSDTLAKVLHEQPKPPSEWTSGIPRDLERLILRCLRKEPDRRIHHMADIRIELQDIKDERDSARPAAPSTDRRRRAAWLAAGLAIPLILISFPWQTSDEEMPSPTSPRLVPITATRGVKAVPSFSPDGTQIAFAWEGETQPGETPAFDIWLKMVGGPEVRRLTTDPQHDMGPSWSPDGRQIAFQRGRLGEGGAIYLISPLGGAERRLSDFPAAGFDTTWFRGAAVSQLAWSPDGRWLAAARQRAPHETSSEAGGIHLVPLDGGDTRAITRPEAPRFDRDPAFSPDGRQLAYASCATHAFPVCDVYVVDLGRDLQPTTTARRLTRQDVSMVGVMWTRDGKSVVYGSARVPVSYLWQVSADGSSPPRRIEAARFGLSPATTASRDRLVFVQSLFDNDVYAFEPGRPARAVASSSFSDYGPSFSPDGQRIAFESGRAGDSEEIWVANADGTNAFQLTSGPGSWQGSPAWSPDGQRIAFDSRREDGFSDIWTISVDRSGLRRITDGPLNEVLPTWSRDGRWIYHRRDLPVGGDLWRVDANTGESERVTQNGGFRAAESWDGTTLYFVRKDDSSPLFARPTSGGPERQVAECVVSRSLAAGPDGIYFVGCPPDRPESLMFRLEYASGALTRLGVVAIGGGFVPGLTVSPDGKRILYSRTISDTADLMMIDHFK